MVLLGFELGAALGQPAAHAAQLHYRLANAMDVACNNRHELGYQLSVLRYYEALALFDAFQQLGYICLRFLGADPRHAVSRYNRY